DAAPCPHLLRRQAPPDVYVPVRGIQRQRSVSVHQRHVPDGSTVEIDRSALVQVPMTKLAMRRFGTVVFEPANGRHTAKMAPSLFATTTSSGLLRRAVLAEDLLL